MTVTVGLQRIQDQDKPFCIGFKRPDGTDSQKVRSSSYTVYNSDLYFENSGLKKDFHQGDPL
jgi:hypothetical protein